MGGSLGGGRSLSERQLKSLEQAAREELKKESEPQKRNVFISFSSDDLNEVNLLRGQAKNEISDLEFKDWSLKKPFDSEQAEYIKRGIRERIRQSSATICYITEKTAKSKWVDWEIRESIKLGKAVVAMHKGEKAPSQLPPAIKELGIRTVSWNHAELMKAIEQEIKNKN